MAKRNRILVARGTYSWQCYLKHPWRYIADLWRDLKAFVQRGRRGYADCDVWNLDDYLQAWLPAALRKLASDNCGYPVAFEENPDDWEKALLQMADGFDSLYKLNEEMPVPDSPIERELLEKWERGSKLFIKHFGSLWD